MTPTRTDAPATPPLITRKGFIDSLHHEFGGMLLDMATLQTLDTSAKFLRMALIMAKVDHLLGAGYDKIVGTPPLRPTPPVPVAQPAVNGQAKGVQR